MRTSASAELRERYLPNAGPEHGYRRVLVIGTTGSGKTTLIRQLLGTAGEEIPATSSSKTTTVDTEFLPAAGDYYAVATFMSHDEVRDLVEDNLVAAAMAIALRRSDRAVAYKLFEHEDQRLRLHYLLGDPGPGPAWNEPYASILAELAAIVGEPSKYASMEDDAALEEALRADGQIDRIADDLTLQIERAILAVSGGQVFASDGPWPDVWCLTDPDRGRFFDALAQVSSNDASRFGSLLTPIVNGLRVRGPLKPAWLTESLRLTITDSEGLGHTAETAMSLPTSLVERFDEVDIIVLVDNAAQPMQAASQAVIRRIVTAGHLAKLVVGFTHVDAVRGPNLAWEYQKQALLHHSLEQALSGLHTMLGPAGRAMASRLADERVFYLGNLHEPLSVSTHRPTLDELLRLLQTLHTVTERSEVAVVPTTIDRDALDAAVDAALAQFRQRWYSRLGLQPPGPAAHWNTVRALARRIGTGMGDQHGDLRPVAELASIVAEQVAVAAAGHGWSSAPLAELSDEFLRDVNREVINDLRTHVVVGPAAAWAAASLLSGAGSARSRSEAIVSILGLADGDVSRSAAANRLRALLLACAERHGVLADDHAADDIQPEPPAAGGDGTVIDLRDDPAAEPDAGTGFGGGESGDDDVAPEVTPPAGPPVGSAGPPTVDDVQFEQLTAQLLQAIATAPEVETTPARVGPVAYSRQLEQELRGRRLALEIGFGPERVDELEQMMREAIGSTNTGPDLVRHHAALLVCHLAAQATFRYQAGEFWGRVLPATIDQSFGKPFLDALVKLGLETFDEMVDHEGAMAYVSRIVAHAGIPAYCASDFWRLLLSGVSRGYGTAAQLLAYWHRTPSAFKDVDKPVRRFLQYGGSLAEDFLDRCIDHLAKVGASTEAPTKLTIPAYLAAELTDLPEDVRRAGKSRLATRVSPILAMIDPWSGEGPYTALPIRSDVGPHAHWLVESGSARVRRPVSRHGEHEVPLAPASSWRVELVDGDQVLESSHLEALEPDPVLLFEPSTERLVRMRAASAGPLYVLHHRSHVLSATSADPGFVLRELTEFPALHGAWSDYVVRHVDLTGAASLAAASRERTTEIRLRPPASRPWLAPDPVVGVTDTAGRPVFAVSPTLHLPPAEVPWTVQVSVDGEQVASQLIPPTESGSGHELPLARWLPDRPATVTVSALGTLGGDTRLTFSAVPDLEVSRPKALRFPGETLTPIRISGRGFTEVLTDPGAHGLRVTIPVGPVDLAVGIPRLAWALTGPNQPVPDFRAERRRIRLDDLLSGELTNLVVHTGEAGHKLTLTLDLDGRSEHTTKAGERWVFDLRRFRENFEQIDRRAVLHLAVGLRPTEAIEIIPSAGVTIHSARSETVGTLATVEVTFEQARPVKDRVLRLWSEHRPWAAPLTQRIPDDATTRFLAAFDPTTLPPGPYRLELVVDDGWSQPARPRWGEGYLLECGTRADVEQRLGTLSPDDPYHRLEFACANWPENKALDASGFEQVGPDLVRSALLLPHERVRGPLERVLYLLVKGRDRLAGLLAGRIEADSAPLGRDELLRLSILLVGRLHPRSIVRDPAIERLWTTAPVLALALELAARRGGAAPDVDVVSGDALTVLGRTIELGSTPVPLGAVTQQWVAMPAEGLADIRWILQRDLVPGIITQDGGVAANFEWLAAEKARPATASAWYLTHRGLFDHTPAIGAHAHEHLQHRRAKNAEAWADLPRLSLYAALLTVLHEEGARPGRAALLDLAAWAPALVTHDLLLAHLLLPPAHQNRAEP